MGDARDHPLVEGFKFSALPPTLVQVAGCLATRGRRVIFIRLNALQIQPISAVTFFLPRSRSWVTFIVVLITAKGVSARCERRRYVARPASVPRRAAICSRRGSCWSRPIVRRLLLLWADTHRPDRTQLPQSVER